MKLIKFLPLFLIVVTTTGLYGEEKVVTLATLTDFAPYCFRKDNSEVIHEEIIPRGNDSSQLQGYSWDVVRESFHELDYTIKLHVVPWERAMHYLNSGRVDAIFPANRTEAREKFFRFSKEYVDRTRIVVYVPINSSLEWKDLDTLNGLRVGVVRGWAYGKKWEGNTLIKKESMDSILQSFLVLDKDRLAAVAGYEIAYDYVLKSAGISENFKKIGSFATIDEYMIGKKDNPRAIRVLNDYDRGHALVELRGGLETISKKWQ